MNRKYRCIFFLLIALVPLFFYDKLLIKSQQPSRILNRNSTLKTISIAHYTTLYGKRADSRTKIFNDNLQQICDVLDPEDYSLADSVFVTFGDLVRFPKSNRNLHPSQLWIFHTEESPRNSYRTVEMNDITDLDDWFNLTSTLQPESDFHIQYRVGLNANPCCQNERFT